METRFKLVVSALVLGVAASSHAAEPSNTALMAQLEAMKAQLATQQAEINQLRSTNNQSWMNERRAEEVKTLIREVLSDADTRSSLMEGGMTAGRKNGKFFIGSEDGNFMLNISGQIQSRYIYNNTDLALEGDVGGNIYVEDADGTGGMRQVSHATFDEDEHEGGFQLRRGKVRFDGHLFDPKLTYALQLAVSHATHPDEIEIDFDTIFDVGGQQGHFDISDDPIHDEVGQDEDTDVFSGDFIDVFDPDNNEQLPNIGAFKRRGDIILEDAWLAYEFADGLEVKFGQFKAPFLREEDVDSKHQLAADRSYTADLFTVDYTQGVQLEWGGELSGVPLRVRSMIHDGSYQHNSDFNEDTTDFAISTRVDILVAGDWAQFDDFAAWSGDPFGVMVGAAVDYEAAETGDDNFRYNILKWTIDVSVEIPDMYGLNIFAAMIGQHLDAAYSNQALRRFLGGSADQYALVAQAGIFIIPDKMDAFIRWEYMDLDNLFFWNSPTGHQIFYPVGLSSATISDNADKPVNAEWGDEINIITFGTNYYFQRHAVKATFDVVWVLDTLPAHNTGQGLRASMDDDQFALRAQVQLLF